jgi:hypothetical protein
LPAIDVQFCMTIERARDAPISQRGSPTPAACRSDANLNFWPEAAAPELFDVDDVQ